MRTYKEECNSIGWGVPRSDRVGECWRLKEGFGERRVSKLRAEFWGIHQPNKENSLFHPEETAWAKEKRSMACWRRWRNAVWTEYWWGQGGGRWWGIMKEPEGQVEDDRMLMKLCVRGWEEGDVTLWNLKAPLCLLGDWVGQKRAHTDAAKPGHICENWEKASL